ncbi:TPA: hypothetical protein DCL30_04360 [Candidatus Peribacteria bacterium]|nr:MAG: hypothetical protein A3J91_02270 [Candidatus Peribacteria bacterium RIFOXYC2_FULL_58_10]OGJ84011.1 MAG: hypothetical protein A2529_04415 [Candidatus Peribacteria bacterium RIFOXYD2_FULL_58_15]HAI98739.1 hypothetical protein [Candidatus Peribacteria bacterium]HAS34141.1 hypothetical protein [Candidatus Peribacteria bacterium]
MLSSPRTVAGTRPIALSSSTQSQVYALFALAMALTAAGVFIGMQYAEAIFSSGLSLFFLIAELILIFTARLWMDRSPLNIILFGAFPLLSGVTVTPYLIAVLTGYANGGAILFNAVLATAFMAGAAAVFASTTKWDLSILGRALLFMLLGLLFFGVLQIFFASLRTTGMEMVISGASIVLFAVFTAYDVQRIQRLARLGANPFLMALSLYLDIFNLFLSILRFMVAVSGNRR